MNLKLLFTVALAGCAAINAGAQSSDIRGFSIGLNAGACRNTKPFNSLPGDKPGKIGSAAVLSLYYRFNKHWEAGIAADYKRLSIGEEGDDLFENNFNPVTGQATGGSTHVNVTAYYPAYTTKAIVNYHFALKKVDAYAGISAGYMTVSSTEHNTDLWNKKYTTSAFSPGAQLGANYRLNRRLSLNAQLGTDAIFLFNKNNRFDMLTVSGLVGVRFHL